MKIKTALISVSDKKNLKPLLSVLKKTCTPSIMYSIPDMKDKRATLFMMKFFTMRLCRTK